MGYCSSPGAEGSGMLMNILLVEPKYSSAYYTKYPPIGLLKLSSYYKLQGHNVQLLTTFGVPNFVPDLICITSLFTYCWRDVHNAIKSYSVMFPKADIHVGGVYASICPDHIRNAFGDRVYVHVGIFEDAEDIIPDYSLVPDWKISIIHATRGCIKKCKVCAASLIEPCFLAKKSIKHLISPFSRRVCLFDNNFLASPFAEDILDELYEEGISLDVTQGLDVEFITDNIARKFKRLKPKDVRIAFDRPDVEENVHAAIDILRAAGFTAKQIRTFCLYNTPAEYDTPDFFLYRVQKVISWGASVYPTRFQPLEPVDYCSYVSPNWTLSHLSFVSYMRKVLGVGGTIIPTEWTIKKVSNAKKLEEVFEPTQEQVHTNEFIA